MGRPKNAKSYHDGSDPPFAARAWNHVKPSLSLSLSSLTYIHTFWPTLRLVAGEAAATGAGMEAAGAGAAATGAGALPPPPSSDNGQKTPCLSGPVLGAKNQPKVFLQE